MNNYTGKEILAWLSFNKNYRNDEGYVDTQCYVYPRYLVEKNGLVEIDPEDFPARGAVKVAICGGQSADEIKRIFGNVLNIKFNVDPGPNHNMENDNKKFAKYNPNHPSTEISFEKICFDTIGSFQLRQVIDFNSTYEDLKQDKAIDAVRQDIISKEVLVRIGDVLYGPFACSKKEDVVGLSAIERYNFYIGKYNLEIVGKQVIFLKDENNQIRTSFMYGLEKRSIIDYAEEKYDWVSDERLIGEIIHTLSSSESEFSRGVRSKIKRQIEEATKNQQSEILKDSSRVEKMFSMLDQLDKNDGLKEKLVNEVLSKQEYRDTLIEFIVETRFDKIKEELEYTKKAIADKLEREEEIQQLDIAIGLRIKEKEGIEKDKKQAIKDLETENIDYLNQIKLEVEVEQKKRDDLINYNKVAEEYLELVQNKDQAKRDYDSWVLEKSKLDKDIDAKIRNVTSEAALKVIDKEFLGRVLNLFGADSSSKAPEPTIFDDSLLLTEYTAQELIGNLSDYVIATGRQYSGNDIINFLVCISQGFVTMFAGEPGTGKTSLCNILVNALGLAGFESNKRFIEVAVERGWSSSKDYIGYYNPLTKTYEKSNKDVFDAFETLNSEGNESRAPYFIILDEANLSPIEHYWANFMRISDLDSNKVRKISIGGDTNWEIPKTLRFLATVNFDHTTEELSQRFLDRTWVIMLDQISIYENMSINDDFENFNKVYDFSKMLDYFTPKDNQKLDKDIQMKWDNIREIFGMAKLPLTPRRINMVTNYCLVAGEYMDTRSAETRYASLDYAVAQKILPSINGVGERYTKLVDGLLNECKSDECSDAMPLCRKHLERMRSAAIENVGYYQFFVR